MPIINFSSVETVLKYSPNQPRTKGGKFAGSATDVAAPKHEGHWDTRHKVDPKDVVNVTDAAEGAKLLADGKFITADVKTATDILREAAKNKTDSDITNIEIKNTPLMTQNNVGIPRKMMPQVDPENKEKWLADTRKQGVKVTEGETDPAKLKPIQSEISAAKVGGIMGAIESGKMDLDSGKLADRIIISKDGYVVDGHHRWAAAAFVSLNTEGGVKIPTLTIDLDYKDSLEQVLDWNKDNGVKLQDLSGKTQKAIMINENNSIPSVLLNNGDGVMKYAAGQARNRMGQFASGGVGGGGNSAGPAGMIEQTEVGSGNNYRTYVKQGLGNPDATTRENLMNGMDNGKALIEHQVKTKGDPLDYTDEPVIPRTALQARVALGKNPPAEYISRMKADTMHSAGMLQGMADNDPNVIGNDYLDRARISLGRANNLLLGYGGNNTPDHNKVILGQAIIELGNAKDVFENENWHQYAESANNLEESVRNIAEFVDGKY